jgi:tRNA modification GTPase
MDEAVYISSVNKDLKELEVKIKEIFKDLSYNDEPLLFNARQLGLLNQAKAYLLEAKRQAENGQVIDLISIDLKQAYICILEILGKNNAEGLLDNIFSKFCLGK